MGGPGPQGGAPYVTPILRAGSQEKAAEGALVRAWLRGVGLGLGLGLGLGSVGC
jgi:hypothetical protein